MGLTKEQINFLENINKNCVHGRNILRKKNETHIEKFYDKYINFYKKMQYNELDKKINAFIKYKKFVSQNNKNNKGKPLFSSQSKFEPTVLEEFLYHLFKEFVDEENNIKVGSVQAYNNLYFSPKNFEAFKKENYIKINKKLQDFSIYKKVILNDEKKNYELYVPVVSIECKTFLDKTMLEGSIATAEKIKTGNPHCKFYIVTETYEVDYKVDPSTSRIDNVFVLKKGNQNAKNKNIQKDVIIKLYNEVKKHLQSNWFDIKNNIEKKGTIF